MNILISNHFQSFAIFSLHFTSFNLYMTIQIHMLQMKAKRAYLLFPTVHCSILDKESSGETQIDAKDQVF